MTIREMHLMFRELGQQMGVQNIRAIYPENIDSCLNTAILNKARSAVTTNVGTSFPDKVSRQNSKISPINALRTLYKVGTISVSSIQGSGTDIDPYTCSIDSTHKMLYTGFSCSINDKTLIDFRIVEREVLGMTLRDYSSRATLSYPIISIRGDFNTIDLDIFTGSVTSIKPKTILYYYIQEPAKVLYDEDNEVNSVDCDMPLYLHDEIVVDAVNYYLNTQRGTRAATTQQ